MTTPTHLNYISVVFNGELHFWDKIPKSIKRSFQVFGVFFFFIGVIHPRNGVLPLLASSINNQQSAMV